MKRLLILSALAAALMTSACITVIDADDRDDLAWHGQDAQPFDAARAECRASTGKGQRSDARRSSSALASA